MTATVVVERGGYGDCSTRGSRVGSLWLSIDTSSMTAGARACATSIRQQLLAEPAQTLTKRRTQQPTGRHVQRRVDRECSSVVMVPAAPESSSRARRSAAPSSRGRSARRQRSDVASPTHLRPALAAVAVSPATTRAPAPGCPAGGCWPAGRSAGSGGSRLAAHAAGSGA